MLAGTLQDAIRAVLERVQNELFDVGADLSVPFGRRRRAARRRRRRSTRSRRTATRSTTDLPELKSFVLPGGTEAQRGSTSRAPSAAAPSARHSPASVNPRVLVYLNRLSDLLFILARAANAAAGRDEPLWKPGSSR